MGIEIHPISVLVMVTYTRLVLGTRQVLTDMLRGMQLSGRVNTSFVERLNLTLRELIAPLSRRTWSLAHSTETLRIYVAWGQTYYNFLRFHEAMRIPVNDGKYFCSRTPAMAAELTRKRWLVQELLTRSLVV
jgi:transposase InsO family protein